MQTGRSLFYKFLLSFLLLAILPGFALAASSVKADTAGYCCAGKTLTESTAKECSKKKGKFYSLKEKTKAQKECKSQAAVPARAVVPIKSEVPAFCCVNGVIKKATKAQCNKMKGSYYTSSAQAKQACKPKKVFCCVDGKISSTSPGECKKQKGTAYKSASEAKQKCKPAAVYCCVDGKIKKSSPQQCKQHKGIAYKSASEAKQKCKPAAVYCCVDGIIKKGSTQQCKKYKGTAYKTAADAKRKCKPADIYCCANGTVRKMSSKQCSSRKGKEYQTNVEAVKACRGQKKAGASTGTEKSGHTTQIAQPMIATGLASAAQGSLAGRNVRVGDRPSNTISPELQSLSSRRSGHCCYQGDFSVKSEASCRVMGGRYYPPNTDIWGMDSKCLWAEEARQGGLQREAAADFVSREGGVAAYVDGTAIVLWDQKDATGHHIWVKNFSESAFSAQMQIYHYGAGDENLTAGATVIGTVAPFTVQLGSGAQGSWIMTAPNNDDDPNYAIRYNGRDLAVFQW